MGNTNAQKYIPPSYLATPKSLKQVSTNTNTNKSILSTILHHTNSPSKVLQDSYSIFFPQTLGPSHMDSNPGTSSIFQVLYFTNPSIFLPCIKTSIKTPGKVFFKLQFIQLTPDEMALCSHVASFKNRSTPHLSLFVHASLGHTTPRSLISI